MRLIYLELSNFLFLNVFSLKKVFNTIYAVLLMLNTFITSENTIILTTILISLRIYKKNI